MSHYPKLYTIGDLVLSQLMATPLWTSQGAPTKTATAPAPLRRAWTLGVRPQHKPERGHEHCRAARGAAAHGEEHGVVFADVFGRDS